MEYKDLIAERDGYVTTVLLVDIMSMVFSYSCPLAGGGSCA